MKPGSTAEKLFLTVLVLVTVSLVVAILNAALKEPVCKETSEIIKIGPDSADRAHCEHEKHRIRVVPEEHWSYARVYCVCK